MSRSRYHRRDRPGHDQLRGRVRRHAGPRAAVGRHPAFPVPQLVAPAETAPRSMLPSFLYLPGEHELPPGAARLPWNDGADRIVGEFARFQGAKVPSQLVSSAKSWLCHPGIDREAESCPGAARPRSRKSRRSRRRPPTCDTSATPGTTRSPRTTRRTGSRHQEVVLTVPASFDEAARELTLEAAKQARLAIAHAARGAAGGVLLLDRLAPGPAGSARSAPAS